MREIEIDRNSVSNIDIDFDVDDHQKREEQFRSLLFIDTYKHYPIMCIDNFYKNPDAVRHFALANQFHHNDGRWPGKRTIGINDLDKVFYDKFCNKLMALLYNLDKTVKCSIDTMFQLVEPMDPDPDSPKNKGWIHQDSNQYLFAGIIYLSPNSDLENGTSIFRVKNPDTINHAESKVKLYRDGVDDNHDSDFLGHTSSFEETIRFNNVYNRMICFPAEAWHGVNSFFNSKDETRLTQVFFVKTIVSPYQTPVMRSAEQNDI